VDRDFVFATKQGEPLDTSTVTRTFQAALRRVDLPRQPFHHLRHAYATLVLVDGEEMVVVSRTLGYSTISTTADVYAHVTPATLQRSAERMNGILWPKADTASGVRRGVWPQKNGPRSRLRGPFHVRMLAGEEGFEPSIS
jgi:hypothetical protein